MDYSLLIVAAGKHAGEGLSYEKALAAFKNGKTVVEYTMSVFLNDEKCKQIVVVTNSADLRNLVLNSTSGKIVYVKGGPTRAQSVRGGLNAVSEEVVLIHDGVRPWIRQKDIDGLLEKMKDEEAAVLAVPARMTLRMQGGDYLGEHVNTEDMLLIQTPQAYKTDFIIDCYRRIDPHTSITDDALLVSSVSDCKIAIVAGDIHNTRYLPKQN